MGASYLVSRIVAFFRKGYPKYAPATGYIPLLALLRRRVTDDEILAIAIRLISRGHGSVNDADVGVELTRITDEMPAPEDVARVHRRLAVIDRPGESPDQASSGD